MNSQDWPEGIKKSKQMISDLNLTRNVIFLGNVPQKQMGYLYQNCDLMVYPSLCESFGFSLIEALGGQTTYSSIRHSLNREICENGAQYFHPLSPAEGAAKIFEDLKTANKEQLIIEGQKRFHSFDWSWNRCAQGFTDIINNMGI